MDEFKGRETNAGEQQALPVRQQNIWRKRGESQKSGGKGRLTEGVL